MIARFCLLIGLVLSAAAASAQNWIEVRSPNFTVVTDANDKRAREVALHFEQMRKVFGTLILRDKVNINAPLQIIAFKNRQGLNRVAPIWKGKPVQLDGFYLGGDDKHFIALNLSSDAGLAPVFHEYAHLLLNANYPRTQLWFDEGFAEYYSTIRINAKEVRVGDPPDGSLELLHSGLMPVLQLLSIVNESDDYYKTGQRRSLFYAESWLLVHYLFDMKKIKEAGQYFTLVKKQNVPIVDALKQAFGMTPKELDHALQDFLGSRNAVFYTMKPPEGIEAVTFSARKMKDFEAESIIADMHQHSSDHVAEAQQEFERILAQNPDYAPAERGLGIAYLAKQQFDEAGKHFRRAAKLGSSDPRVYYYIGYFLYRKVSLPGASTDPEMLVDLNEAINRAIDLDPEFADAYNLRSFALLRARNYPQAIEAMKTAIRLSPRNEEYKLNLANQYLTANRYDDAIALFGQLSSSADPNVAKMAAAQMQTAKEWKEKPLLSLSSTVKEPEDSAKWQRKPGGAEDSEMQKLEEAQRNGGEHQEAESEADTRPVKFVKGTLVKVECFGQLLPAGVLTVTAGGKSFKLASKNVSKILIIGADAFSCGWKNRKVSVNYREKGATTGDIVSLEVY